MSFTSFTRAFYMGSMVVGVFAFDWPETLDIIHVPHSYSNPKVFLAEPLLDVLHIVRQGFLHGVDGHGSVSI